ncbi:hypothetical protein C5P10_26680 [Escherichia coli]|nr:hypothetical protein C5P10_26680 [Escherichia coli]PZV29908.1 hypothetical protein DM465_17595 [Escherichia coli]RQN44089.1 hypothetical protein C3445_26195 [Escherichia coli]
MLLRRNSTLQELTLTVLWGEMDKDGAIDIIVFFCSFGVISTGNNLTPASEVVVTGRRRETTQVQENKVVILPT